MILCFLTDSPKTLSGPFGSALRWRKTSAYLLLRLERKERQTRGEGGEGAGENDAPCGDVDLARHAHAGDGPDHA